MAEFVQVARLADLPDPSHHLFEVDDRVVVLAHLGGQLYCIDDICTHDGGPLSDGGIDGLEIACPRHGAKFDLRTGKALTMPATEDTLAHEVKVEEGLVYIRLNDPDAPRPAVPTPVVSTAGTTGMPATPESMFGTNEVVNDGVAKSSPSSAAEAESTNRELSEDRVREELKKVIDPELFVNIVDLGLIYNVDLVPHESGKIDVKIDMTMTSPMCPAGPQMIANSKQVLAAIDQVGNVEVKIVLDPPWTPDKMTDDARDQLGIF